MAVQIHDCEQGTPEWHAIRAGVPTASCFKDIMAKGEGKMRRSYMLRLAGEIITGEPAETYSNDHMLRGQVMEDEARRYYAFQRDVEPRRVGFVTNDGLGCSPDSLVDEDGGLEIKTALPHIQIERLLADKLPPEHRAQVQGFLLVTERAWIDFVSYWPKCPPLIVRVYRDEDYLRILREEIDRFQQELADVVERVRRYGAQEAA